MVSLHCGVCSLPHLSESPMKKHLGLSSGATNPERLNPTHLRPPHILGKTPWSCLTDFPLAPNHRANQTMVGRKPCLVTLGFVVLLIVVDAIATSVLLFTQPLKALFSIWYFSCIPSRTNLFRAQDSWIQQGQAKDLLVLTQGKPILREHLTTHRSWKKTQSVLLYAHSGPHDLVSLFLPKRRSWIVKCLHGKNSRRAPAWWDCIQNHYVMKSFFPWVHTGYFPASIPNHFL